MALRERGTIVHVSSDAAVNAYANWGAYSVSKAALDHLARVFAAELDARGVRSFSVDPGEMAMRMHAAALPDADPSTLARTAQVASQIVALVRARNVPNGARVAASNAGAYS
jgi:NAD(P)-dependent dehydrogenase (short-subunit alcohol dehydrogenase family)